MTKHRDAPGVDEIEMLRDSTRRFFADGGTLGSAGDLGFLGLLTPEAAGGSGWLPVEACIVAEEAGRALTETPWAATAIAAAALTIGESSMDGVAALLAGTIETGLARRGSVITHDDGTVSGTVLAHGSATPDAILVIDDDELIFVETSHAGVDVAAVPEALDTTRPVIAATFARAPSIIRRSDSAAALADVATLLSCADALGALERTTTLVREHLVDRQAFERPIASFQVIQHRLADLEVVQAATAALVRRAARSAAKSAATTRWYISAAHAYVAMHVTAALDDCIQLAGGVGFTWEWPVHHALRRTAVDCEVPRRARSSLRHLGQNSQGSGQTEARHGDFREHVRAVIRDGAPFESREGHRAPSTPEQEAALRSWYRTMYESGLLGASWPAERGGNPDHQPEHEVIVTEELIRARAPRPIDQVQLASHVLMQFGTDHQKDHYLPRIRDGRDIWCQLFSEPDAGSDLAGIKAAAERRKDGSWVLRGQKTWTTDAHWAQMGLALLRTSTGATRHKGITAFLVPMDSPGLEIQAKLTMGGAYEFNDVFLDDVVLASDSVIGPVDGGWGVAMSGLEVERFGVGGNVVLLDLLLEDLRSLAEGVVADDKLLIDHADVRRDIASFVADAQAAQAFISDHVERTLLGQEQPADASIAKVLHTETYNRIARYGAELASAHAPLRDAASVHGRRLVDAWLWSRALTISGGSSEVMRNIIAKRRLRLPGT